MTRKRAPKVLPPGVKDGRPKKVIDWVTFDKLCALHCTAEEIASILGISTDTLDRELKAQGVTFAERYKEKSAHGKISLRRRQYEAAMKGDRTMMIWLGKQWLNQSEKQEVHSTTVGGQKIIIEIQGDSKQVDEAISYELKNRLAGFIDGTVSQNGLAKGLPELQAPKLPDEAVQDSDDGDRGSDEG